MTKTAHAHVIIKFVLLMITPTSVISTLSLHDALPIWNILLLKLAGRLIKTVGKDAENCLHVRPYKLKSFCHRQGRSASRNKIFDNNRGLSFVDTLLNLISQSVRFGPGTDIRHRFVQVLCNPGGVRDTCSSCSGNYICVTKLLRYEVRKPFGDGGA